MAVEDRPLPLFSWALSRIKRRKDGRLHDTGTIRPYRPCPSDFTDRFLEMGQSKEIEEHYRTNYRCIRRWIEESGGDELRAQRSKITGCPQRPYKRARNYVLGNTMGRGK